MQKIQQQAAAKAFAERWAGKGYEKGESPIAYFVHTLTLQKSRTRRAFSD